MLFPRKATSIAVGVFLLLLSPLAGVEFRELFAQQVGHKDKPAQAPKVENTANDYSQEAFVLEELKTSYRFEKDGTGERVLSTRVKIQSDAGVERFGQLMFDYSSANEKLDIEYVRVLKEGGSVVTAALNDIQDLTAPIAREAPIYTDLRQKHVTVPGLRPGDLLEYRVVWHTQTPLAANHFWMEHNFINKQVIVLDDELLVNIPKDSKIKLKTETGFDPSISETADRREYSWKRANLKREDEDKDKDKEDKDDKDETAEADDDPKPPNVQLTTFQSWDEVGQWYAELQKTRIVPNDPIRAKTADLIRGKTNERDKIQALYEYVAKNFRYVSLSLGQGRYQPHAASDVMSNEYGDCKDKHTLFAAMLNAAGLSAYPALMNSGRNIDVAMPSPGQFNHVITAIPLGTDTLWADTTAEVAPFQLLAPPLRDKKVLLIPAAGAARIESTPTRPPFQFSEVVTVEGEVSELGKLTAHTKLVLRGDSELLFRIMFRKTPQSSWKDLGYYLALIAGIRGEVTGIKAGDPAALDKPFEIEYDIKRDDFIDWSSKKVKVEIPLPSLNLSRRGVKEKSTKPFPLGPPIDVDYKLKLTFPSKYQTKIPVPLSVKRDYGDYAATYKLEGSVMSAERILHVRQHELPSDRLQDYRAFVAATQADEAQTVSLETDVAGTPSIPDSVKTEELIQAGDAAMKSENYPMAEELLKRVLTKDPKQKMVRRQLGYALYRQRKFVEAVSVLQEQAKLNPFDDYVYNLMGQAFWAQQNYPEAEKSFRKQLDISPLDRFATANLGRLLVDWRKYKEAVPELEKAISLDGDNESLHVSLANAYFRLGEEKKGLEAAEAAVKLDPGPGVWNDVAYMLAEVNVSLDKAQQYAESAVTAVTTELRNAELERLTDDDLLNVSAIYAYWDTLGWVHFRKGDLDTAEKYLLAAWFVSPHSAVSYHLGQIAEKRGKNDEAIRYYALSAVEDQPLPEARESLERLLKKEKIEDSLRKAKEESAATNLYKLAPVTSESAEAEFYVVVAPDATRKGAITELKFIKGNEKLRPLAAKLKTIGYGLTFPDAAPTKIIRRAKVVCSGKGPCEVTLIRPELISSVD